MSVYRPFSGDIMIKNYSMYPIEVDIEDRADQRRLSNTGLDHFEHITEGVNGITDIPD